MNFSDLFSYVQMLLALKDIRKELEQKKVMLQCKGKIHYIKIQIKHWKSEQNWLWMYSPHFFVLHLMMHIQAFTYVKMLKKSFYGLGFTKNWLEIGQKG